jgi:addiction module HigA family antidote
MLLEEELEVRGMTQRELAKRTGRPVQVINEIVRGKKTITHETALELEKVLGIPAHVWINLESIYRMTLARNQERSRLEQQAGWLDKFPVKEMERRGWLPSHPDKVDKVRALLEFLGIATFENTWIEAAVGFRITGGGKVSEEALAVWLRKGEIDGRQLATETYSESRFLDALDKIREVTSRGPQEFMPEMRRLCAEAGVAFVLTQEFPRSGANGVARWLTPEKALIQLSIRWSWADVFWFTFFHEACHVLKHDLKIPYVEGKLINKRDAAVEAEADEFAGDSLIQPPDWARFVEAGDWSAPAVRRFAQEVNIDPGIVVGRMQHEGIIPFSQLSGLKSRYQWVETSEQ